MVLPSDSVSEAAHYIRDMLKVPDGLAGLLGVGLLQLRHPAGPHDLVGVRLRKRRRELYRKLRIFVCNV